MIKPCTCFAQSILVVAGNSFCFALRRKNPTGSLPRLMPAPPETEVITFTPHRCTSCLTYTQSTCPPHAPCKLQPTPSSCKFPELGLETAGCDRDEVGGFSPSLLPEPISGWTSGTLPTYRLVYGKAEVFTYLLHTST